MLKNIMLYKMVLDAILTKSENDNIKSYKSSNSMGKIEY